MKFNERNILLLLSGILVGILITSLIVNTSVSPTTFLSYQDYESMSMDANQLRIELRGLNKEINQLNQKLMKYNESGGKSKTIIDTIQKELTDVKTSSGYSTVEGPGLRILINDRHKKNYKDMYDVTFSTTHDTDILFVVNDLRNAGAEAISVNGNRIVGNTSITCEGPVIMVNGQYIVPPFEILAIGDTDALNYELNSPDGKFYDLKIRDLELKVEKKSKIYINGYDYNINTKYAKSSE